MVQALRISTTDPSRRAVAGGLFAAVLGSQVLGGPARAQTGLVSPETDAEQEARIEANLFTRMSTRTVINGGPAYNFVIDTGAGRTAIAADIADQLALPPGPPVLVHGVTSAEVARTVKIARIDFGRRRLNDIHAAVFPREMLAADGLLGLDVLSRFELRLDMSRRTYLLRPSGPELTEFGRAFQTGSRIRRETAARTRRGEFGQLILLNARVEGVLVQCFVDSGAQYSIGNLALLRAVGARQGNPSIQRSTIQVYGVTGQTIQAQSASVGQLEINGARLGPTNLLFADLHAFGTLDLADAPALLIGGDILYRFRNVSLDFGRSRMAFSGLRRPPTPATRT